MQKKIFMIENNERLCKMLHTFNKDFFQVDYNITGKDFEQDVISNNYALIIIDVEINDVSGFDVFKQIKKIYSGPIIFLSGKTDEETRIYGMKLGAEDYVSKPFSMAVLQLKIERIISRSQERGPLIIGEYEIDELYQRISYGGRQLNLSVIPYRLLVFLLKNANRDLTREEICDQVWNCDYIYGCRLIDTNISTIRHTTGDWRIASVRNVGYRYELD